MSDMNGAECLVRTLVASGVDTCFANPGTSEMHFVAALDRVPGIRCVLALFEGVATGAADGYARLARKPAATCCIADPGLANGLANLHNAQRARVPMVNIVGDQATYHRPLDAPLDRRHRRLGAPGLGVDADGPERGDSGCRCLSRRAGGAKRLRYRYLDLALRLLVGRRRRARRASSCRRTIPGDAGNDRGRSARIAHRRAGGLDDDWCRARDEFARRSSSYRCQDQRHAHCSDLQRFDSARARALPDRTPALYRRPSRRVLSGVRHLILVGAQEPVGFFAYPGKPSRMVAPGAVIHVLARPEEDAAGALAALAAELDAPPVSVPPSQARLKPAHGPITSAAVAQTLAALIPEDAVVIDESISFGFAFYPGTRDAAPHDWLQLTGGAIGDGLPLATGAAIAAPGRRIINLEGDGSALYTVQALWTQAREKLDVTTVILSNRKYAILEIELAKVGADPGRTALDLFDTE